MKTYTVTIIRTAYAHILVQAENEEQAKEKAWEQYQGDADDCASSDIYEVEENLEKPEE
jgi:hypothetical protein